MSSIIFIIAAVLMLIGLAMFVVRARRLYLSRAEEIAYRQRTEPLYVIAFHAGDDTVFARAREAERKLARAGNRFGREGKPVPVVPKPYISLAGNGMDRHVSYNDYLVTTGRQIGEELAGWWKDIYNTNRPAYEAAKSNGHGVA